MFNVTTTEGTIMHKLNDQMSLLMNLISGSEFNNFIEKMTVAHPRIPVCMRCREANPTTSHKCDLIEDELLMNSESSQTSSRHLRDEEERYEEQGTWEKVTTPTLKRILRLYKRITGTNRVAIVIPTRNSDIDQMIWGFVKSLDGVENVKVVPHLYNMDGDSIFLRKTILPLLRCRNYDLIYTIGGECTSTVVNFFNYQSIQVPILFAGIANIRQLGLDTYAKDYVSGVQADDRLPLQVASLLAVKPNTKKVGIIYPRTNNSVVEFFKNELHRLLREYGAEVVFATVAIPQEVKEVAKDLASKVDTLIIPRDLMVSREIDVLTEICNEVGITLYGSQMHAVEEGAALAFGSFLIQTGSLIAQMAALILRDGIPVKDIPITHSMEKHYLVVNPDTRHKQGLFIELDRLILIEHVVSRK